jgi:hypothetical protein
MNPLSFHSFFSFALNLVFLFTIHTTHAFLYYSVLLLAMGVRLDFACIILVTFFTRINVFFTRQMRGFRRQWGRGGGGSAWWLQSPLTLVRTKTKILMRICTTFTATTSTVAVATATVTTVAGAVAAAAAAVAVAVLIVHRTRRRRRRR